MDLISFKMLFMTLEIKVFDQKTNIVSNQTERQKDRKTKGQKDRKTERHVGEYYALMRAKLSLVRKIRCSHLFACGNS